MLLFYADCHDAGRFIPWFHEQCERTAKKNAAILTGGSAAPYIHVQAPIQELQKKKAMR